MFSRNECKDNGKTTTTTTEELSKTMLTVLGTFQLMQLVFARDDEDMQTN